MANKYLYPGILLTFILLSTGCSSGKKSLQRGNYYDAVMKAVNRLRSKPNQKKARETLRSGYPLSVAWFLDQSKNLIASNDPKKWRNVVYNYEKINQMYEAIRKSPGALNIIPNPKSYYSELVESKNKAAEESYTSGLLALNSNTREGAKQAYFDFMEADRFVPGFKDTRDKIDEAKYYATLKVVVNQIPVPSLRYKVTADFFQEKVQEFLSSYNTNEFVRYYSPREAQVENLEHPDQLMKIQFQDFLVGQTHVKETVENLVKENVKVGELKIEKDSVVDVFGEVKAKLTTFRKQVISSGVLNMLVVDAHSQKVLFSENFASEFVWYTEWGYFNGDERALDKEQLAICKKREIPPPPPQELFIAFTDPIYNQLTQRIRGFYSRY
ncbi:MAG: hypothetical protein MI921_05105 [Cytophagales bacterium]|nr:hypothetical protein [Cytophagales bacterium]